MAYFSAYECPIIGGVRVPIAYSTSESKLTKHLPQLLCVYNWYTRHTYTHNVAVFAVKLILQWGTECLSHGSHPVCMQQNLIKKPCLVVSQAIFPQL